MSDNNNLRTDLIKIVVSALMALILVPLITWSFVRYALPPGAAEMVAETFTFLWQFQVAGQVSAATLIAGVVVLLIICILGAAAFANRVLLQGLFREAKGAPIVVSASQGK